MNASQCRNRAITVAALIPVLLLFSLLISAADQQDDRDRMAAIRAKAEQGDSAAQRELGEAYAAGSGVPRDATEAVKWFRKAAEQGNTKAQYDLGVMHNKGEGVPRDATEAMKWFRMAAGQGNAEAQSLLGVLYSKGMGVPKDAVEAVKWFRMAAEQGDAGAQFILGLVCSKGEGVPKDAVEAIKWYRMAAEQGHEGAQFNLGLMYLKGQGVPKDAVEAIKWYRMAAEQGNAWAQFTLGAMYSNGEGVPKDAVEAIKWYRTAAEQGNAEAQFTLGAMYSNGEGVPKDAVEAIKWYRMAAEQGNAGAQFNLGVMYCKGDGVPRDDVQAYKWWNLAAANGDDDAARNRARVEAQMTPSQVAEAQRLSREFRPAPEQVGAKEPSDRAGGESNREAVVGSGSGFFISSDGYLVTNAHVVEAGSSIKVLTSAGLKRARLVRTDPANDLAVLWVEGKFTALPVVSSRTVKLGQTVATVGFPNVGLQGFSPKLAKGEVAGLAGVQDDPKHFQISVPVQPGNSGGALVDNKGNVVGVVLGKLSQTAAVATAGVAAENVNYAIKSSFLLGFLESLPEVADRLEEPGTKELEFSQVVKRAETAAVLVLVY